MGHHATDDGPSVDFRGNQLQCIISRDSDRYYQSSESLTINQHIATLTLPAKQPHTLAPNPVRPLRYS